MAVQATGQIAVHQCHAVLFTTVSVFSAKIFTFLCTTNIINVVLFFVCIYDISLTINPLASNDVYTCRIAQLTSRRCILNIYSTNTLAEYFKHAARSPFFSLQDAVYFIMLSFLVPVIFTF